MTADVKVPEWREREPDMGRQDEPISSRYKVAAISRICSNATMLSKQKTAYEISW